MRRKLYWNKMKALNFNVSLTFIPAFIPPILFYISSVADSFYHRDTLSCSSDIATYEAFFVGLTRIFLLPLVELEYFGPAKKLQKQLKMVARVQLQMGLVAFLLSLASVVFFNATWRTQAATQILSGMFTRNIRAMICLHDSSEVIARTHNVFVVWSPVVKRWRFFNAS